MFSLFRKQKYFLEDNHLKILKNMEDLIRGNRLNKAIELGLKNRKSISDKGDAFIFFYTYFIFTTKDFAKLRREMADVMINPFILSHFNKVDAQYIIDVTAMMLNTYGGGDMPNKAKVFELSKGFPNKEDVDPTILHFCNVKKLY